MKKTLSILSLVVLSSIVLFGCEKKEEDRIIKIPTLNSSFSPEDTTAPPVVLVSEEAMETIRTGDLAERVEILVPEENEQIDSPYQVKGKAPGNWFIEANAPVYVLDSEGLKIGEGILVAQGEWMTEALVDFIGTVTFELSEEVKNNSGKIVFEKGNASNTPSYASVEVPITFMIQ